MTFKSLKLKKVFLLVTYILKWNFSLFLTTFSVIQYILEEISNPNTSCAVAYYVCCHFVNFYDSDSAWVNFKSFSPLTHSQSHLSMKIHSKISFDFSWCALKCQNLIFIVGYNVILFLFNIESLWWIDSK